MTGIKRSLPNDAYLAAINSDAPSASNPFATKGGVLKNIGEVQNDPTGFVNRTDSNISFENSTRTFSIEPAVDDFQYYIDGDLKTKSALESIVISDVEGIHFVCYDGDTLSETTTFSLSLITDCALVAVIYWDATNSVGKLADERHGHKMPSSVHVWIHKHQNAKYSSGMNLDDFVIDDGDVDSHAQFSVSTGTFDDEDIALTVPSSSSTDSKQIYYFDASGNARWLTQDNVTETEFFPVLTDIEAGVGSTGRLVYNEEGVGLQTVTSRNFVLCHIIATNFGEYGYFVGQTEYGTRNAARDGIETEAAALYYGQLASLTPEFVIVASVIFQTSNGYGNAVKARVVEYDTGVNFFDWRFNIIQGAPGVPGISETETDGTTIEGTGVSGDPVKIKNFSDGLSYVNINGAWVEASSGIPEEVIDTPLDSVKVLEQAPENTFWTDSELLVSEQNLTTSYVDFGSEIDTCGHNLITLYVDVDINSSTGVYIKLIGLDEIGGNEYEIRDLKPVSVEESDGSYAYTFDINSLPYVKVQAYAENILPTAGDLTISYNLKYIKGFMNKSKAGVFAYLSASANTTITTASTFQYIEGTFLNPVIEGFSLTASPAIQCDITQVREYEIDWHATIKGNSNGINVKVGIGITGAQPNASSIMGTYLKTSGESQAVSGTTVVELGYGDEVQLMITTDGTADIMTVDYFTTTIRPFFEER